MTKYVETYLVFSKHDNKYFIIINVQSLLLSSSYLVFITKKSSLIAFSIKISLFLFGMNGKGNSFPILYMSF